MDPLESNSRILEADIVGEEHYRVANQVLAILLEVYGTAADIIAILGMEELSDEDKITVMRARKSRDLSALLVAGDLLPVFPESMSR